VSLISSKSQRSATDYGLLRDGRQLIYATNYTSKCKYYSCGVFLGVNACNIQWIVANSFQEVYCTVSQYGLKPWQICVISAVWTNSYILQNQWSTNSILYLFARLVPASGETASELVLVEGNNYYSSFKNLHFPGNCEINSQFRELNAWVLVTVPVSSPLQHPGN